MSKRRLSVKVTAKTMKKIEYIQKYYKTAVGFEPTKTSIIANAIARSYKKVKVSLKNRVEESEREIDVDA